jgi:hypothetical protein
MTWYRSLAHLSACIAVLGLFAVESSARADLVCGNNGICINHKPGEARIGAQFRGGAISHFNFRYNRNDGRLVQFEVDARTSNTRSADLADLKRGRSTVSVQACNRTSVGPIGGRSTCTGWFSRTIEFGQAAGGAQPAKGDKWDRRVAIINGTNVVVNNFYASNIARKNWEGDRLGNRVLRPGQSFTANIDDGTGACLFDFRAVLANGRAVEARRVDVCRITSWTIR